MKGLALTITLLASAAAAAPVCPPYRPHPATPPAAAGYLTTDGAIRIVGYNDMAGMIERWNAGFAAAHPGFRFVAELPSTRSAPPALLAGRSALAPMGAPFTAEDLTAYRTTVGGSPLMVEVAHASLDAAALSGPLAVVVADDSPLRSIRWTQVRRLFTGSAPVTFGQLGVSGAQATQPVHLIGLNPGTALTLYFQARALGGAPLSAALTGFGHSTEVVAAVKQDPSAIAFAGANTVGAGVRVLPIETGRGMISLSRDTLRNGRYPLDRRLMIYAKRPLEPWIAEYLRYVLSCEGQAAVEADRLHYIALSGAELRRQRQRIDREARP